MMADRSLTDDSLTTAENAGDAPPALAHRADIHLANGWVRPSLRMIEGPAGSATVEPQVMRVLLALHDAGGAVRTRDDLLRLCWPGVIVGEDSLNRAIGEARRAVRETGADLAIETIPRVGYRLRIADAPPPKDSLETPPVPVTRRRLIIGGAAAMGIVAVAGAGLFLRERANRRIALAIDRGRAALRDALPVRDADAVAQFRQAVVLDPDDAGAWGWLALALRRVAIRAPIAQAQDLFRQSEEATERALAIDPREPNARVAFAWARRELDDRIIGEDRLRAILADAPDNIAALNSLTALLQAVGRCRASWDSNERAIALDPLDATQQHRRALKHWIFGRPTQADQVIDAALRRWPRHPLLWSARMHIYAFTGRPRAGLAAINDADARPREEKPGAVDVWRTTLLALESRAAADVARARDANLAAAMRAPGAAAQAIMSLSALGEIDAAYAVAEGFLLRRGAVVVRPAGPAGPALMQDPQWQNTQWLFTPATAPLRAAPRFGAFCRDIGLAEYWQRRGIGPDK